MDLYIDVFILRPSFYFIKVLVTQAVQIVYLLKNYHYFPYEDTFQENQILRYFLRKFKI